MYFSDKETGQKDRISEDITISVWNGIVSIFEEFKGKNYFSENFSEKCHDNGRICGFDNKIFESRVKSEIPNIEIPIIIKVEKNTFSFNDNESVTNIVNKYTALDFIEFCFKNISEAIQDDYHDFFKHYHLDFKNSQKLKDEFRIKINQIFERNGIVFDLNENGKINRLISKIFEPLINKIYKTNDIRLNKLVKLSQEKFILPKIKDRIYALEKIWDAFERMKTYYIEKNKKQSIDELIQLVSNANTNFEVLLSEECKSLTNIGNYYQIRHFETNKIEITDNKHIDYLYYRMISLIHLFLSELEN